MSANMFYINPDFYNREAPALPTFKRDSSFHEYQGGGAFDPTQITTLFASILASRKDLENELTTEVAESIQHYQEMTREMGVPNVRFNCYGDHTMRDIFVYRHARTIFLPILCFCPKFIKNHLKFRVIPGQQLQFPTITERLFPRLCNDPAQRHHIAELESDAVNDAVHDISQEQMDGVVAHELGHLIFKSTNPYFHTHFLHILQVMGGISALFYANAAMNPIMDAFKKRFSPILQTAFKHDIRVLQTTITPELYIRALYAYFRVIGICLIAAQMGTYLSEILKTRFQNREEGSVDLIAAGAGYGKGLKDFLKHSDEFVQKLYMSALGNRAQSPSCGRRAVNRITGIVRSLTPGPILSVASKLYKAVYTEIYAGVNTHPSSLDRIKALESYC